MISTVASLFIDLFVGAYTLLLVGRVVMSFVTPNGGRLLGGLVQVTEPLIMPVRRIIPQTPGLDLAPLVTYILLRVVQYLVHRGLGQ